MTVSFTLCTSTAGIRLAVTALVSMLVGEGRMDSPPPSVPAATETRPPVDVAALGDEWQRRHPFLR